MRIMVIEDNQETADYLSRGLGEAGWTVTHHPEPGPALLELAGASYDAIVLDRMLPGMDGIAALQLLRSANVTTPVLMLTARSGIEDRVAGRDAGADDYLVKPFALCIVPPSLTTGAHHEPCRGGAPRRAPRRGLRRRRG